jgi:hypothetical protein
VASPVEVTNVTPDHELLARFVAGDWSAGVELRARYETTAYAIAYSALRDSAGADSAVAEAFRALPAAARIEATRTQSVASWISELVHGAALRLLSAAPSPTGGD